MFDYNLPIPNKPTHHIIDGSKLNRFMECPRAFFYEYMLGWRSEKPNNHLVFGSAWHEALEHLLINGFEKDSILDAYRKFELYYRQTFPNPELDRIFWPKTPDRAFECLVGYAKANKNDFKKYEVLFTEIALTVQMDEKRVLYGRMDSIVKNLTNGLIESLEHKSGSSAYKWGEQFEMCMQAGIYSHALMCLYGFDQVGGIIFNGALFLKVKGTRGGEKFAFIREHVRKSKNQMLTWHTNTIFWMDQVEREYQLLEQCSASDPVLRAFPQNTTNCTKWFGCAYKDYCNAWPNPLQKCQNIPVGMIEEHWDPTAGDSNYNIDLNLNGKSTVTEVIKNES